MKTVFKFALVGVSSSGKTTLAYDILATLKRQGIKVDGAVNEYRREMMFDLATIESNPWAQYWMVLQRAAVEAALAARPDVDVIISDRSVLDSYAHMVVQRQTPSETGVTFNDPCDLSGFVREWCGTYTKMYLVRPLPFAKDGLRTDKFRETVFNYLHSTAEEFGVITSLPRERILEDILATIEQRVSR